MDEQGRAREEEELRKEDIYHYLEKNKGKTIEALQSAKQYYASGKFEDPDVFVPAISVTVAQRNYVAANRDFNTLYSKPYFGHVKVTVKDEGISDHIFLSDCDCLEESIVVSEDRSTLIAPFKRMRNAPPLLEKLRLLYTTPTRGDFTVNVQDTRNGANYTTVYTLDLVRTVEVICRKIIRIETRLPEIYEGEEGEHIGADELLAQKLQEYRANDQLRNIISTLQYEQIRIIQSDADLNFVVQACAGSGKTQCLIHRLFYLRETLSERGWDKVLVITPTQLFRNYSSDLMRRYRLTDVANCSLADFYYQLLQSYDQRFRNRQYQFELTEEYLPDKYLQRVYDPRQIAEIEAEIKKAIRGHVQEGCSLAGIEFDAHSPITIDFVNHVVQQLNDAIRQFDDREKALSDDPEYREHRDAFNEQNKLITALKRRQADILKRRSEISSEKERYDQLLSDLAKAKAKEAEKDENVTAEDLHSKAEVAGVASNGHNIPLAANGITEECQKALDTFLKKKSPAAWLRKNEQKRQRNQAELESVEKAIEECQHSLDEHIVWFQEHNVEGTEKERRTYRASMGRARNYLSRIESSVFEEEVWNALTPLKKECGIETLRKEQLADGHQRQTRILYKSDLLFYLKIYMQLYATKSKHNFEMICIDEGQDLHAADYQLIRAIYPDATLNIFGDTEQVLHESCGISDWRRETDIDTVYTMDVNYRSAPAIVDFCNSMFGSNMKYCGAVQANQRPKIINTTTRLLEVLSRGETSTVVLKDRVTFEQLLELVGDMSSRLEYIDTKCNSVPTGKIACYSVYAAKGLEFLNVLVFSKGMNRNQKIVACTRAKDGLFYFE